VCGICSYSIVANRLSWATWKTSLACSTFRSHLNIDPSITACTSGSFLLWLEEGIFSGCHHCHPMPQAPLLRVPQNVNHFLVHPRNFQNLFLFFIIEKVEARDPPSPTSSPRLSLHGRAHVCVCVYVFRKMHHHFLFPLPTHLMSHVHESWRNDNACFKVLSLSYIGDSRL